MLNLDKNMIALIMIGGESRRMGGGIKSFIKFNDKYIFDRVLETAKKQIKKIIINCNVEETKLYKYKIPIIKDLKNGYMGPLAGIHAAMSWIRNNDPQIEWLITLPGDTPFIPADLISNFKNKILHNTKIILAQSENKIHPIVGAWHLSLYDSLDSQLDLGIRKILSWAELHPLDFVKYPIESFDPFFNINTKEDINIAAKIEKKFFLEKS
jgi:molybdopterin-guanine dinucleotide biosynthesis protein A